MSKILAEHDPIVLHLTLPPSALQPSSERAVAEYHMKESGLEPKDWARHVDQSRPIEACILGNKLQIGDGHHRHLAAEILNIPVEVIAYGIEPLPPEFLAILEESTRHE